MREHEVSAHDGDGTDEQNESNVTLMRQYLETEYFGGTHTHGAKADCQRGWMVCDPNVAIIFLSSLTHGLIFPCYPVHGPAIKIFAGASKTNIWEPELTAC